LEVNALQPFNGFNIKAGNTGNLIKSVSHCFEIPGNFYGLILLTILPSILPCALRAGILITRYAFNRAWYSIRFASSSLITCNFWYASSIIGFFTANILNSSAQRGVLRLRVCDKSFSLATAKRLKVFDSLASRPLVTNGLEFALSKPKVCSKLRKPARSAGTTAQRQAAIAACPAPNFCQAISCGVLPGIA
jgi:hypothetical protein